MESTEARGILRKGILHNITWLTASSLLVRPLWFVFITAFCMRVLGTSGYGVMTAALSLMAIASLFSDLGTFEYTVREVARDGDRAPRFFSNFMPAKAVLAALAWTGGLVVGWGLGYVGSDFLALGAAGLYVMALRLTEYCRAFYRAFEVMHYEAISVVLEKALVVGLGVLFLLRLRTTEGVLAGMALGMAVGMGLNIVWVHLRVAPVRLAVLDLPFLRVAFRQALPFGVMTLFAIVFLSSGTVLLEALEGEAAAGQYGAAYRLLEALQVLPATVVAAVFPRLSSLHQQRESDAFRHILRRSLLLTGLASAVVAVALALLAPAIIHLLDPSGAFDEAAALLRIIIWNFPLMTLSYVLHTALIALDQQRFMAVVLGAAAVLLIGLNVLFIPVYSYFAPAWALVVSQSLVLVSYVWRYRSASRLL